MEAFIQNYNVAIRASRDPNVAVVSHRLADGRDVLDFGSPILFQSKEIGQVHLGIYQAPLTAVANLMLVMLAILMMKPERWIAEHASPRAPRLWVEVPLLFAIGAYGGFLQAGVGIFLLAALVLGAGFNLVGANGVKNLIVLLITVAAIPVFVMHDQVQWMLGLLLGCGQALGAWVAARVAIKRGAAFVRIFVIVTVLLSALALFAGFG